MNKSLAALGLLVVTGCSSGGANAAAPQSYDGPQTQQQRVPGANGLLASIDGHTLQVQSSTEQTAVTWSAATTFTDSVTTTAAAVTVGSCVMVRDGSTSTAVSVAVSAPVNGSCTAGLDRRQDGGLRGTPPSGFTPPSGAPGGQARGVLGGGAFGKVISKTATGFVVQGTLPGQTTTTSTTVTTAATTTYTTQRKVTSAALKVGQCVSALGQADSAGTVAARSIAIRPKTNGSCDSGFGATRG